MGSKKPWLVKGVPWKTESAFWVWVRGILRKGWSRHPVKIEYIRSSRKRITNPKLASRRRFPEVWGMVCEICQKDHVQGDIEIDHKGDNATFTGLSDAESYVKHLYIIDFESLRALCKPCHKIVSHSQNTGITFEEAKFQKRVISITSKKASEVIVYLNDLGYSGDAVSNPAKRKQLIEEILRNGQYK